MLYQPIHPLSVVCMPMCLLSGLALTAHAPAAESVWTSIDGGTFQDAINWDIGTPGVSDSALFDLGGDYIVDFSANKTHTTLTIADDEVIFDLSTRTYSLVRIITGAGAGDDGDLTIKNGTVSLSGAALVRVGKDAGSFGMLAIGENANVTGVDLLVGDAGTGMLTIRNGGMLSSTSASVGDDATAMGTLTVDGLGSTWSGTGNFDLGNFGDAEFNVLNGATATSAGLTRVGDELDATGALVVDGLGSSWECLAELALGNRGTGGLDVSNGASITTTRVKLGDETGSIGTATITGAGSMWTDNVEVFVGNFGSGSVTVSDGATLGCIAGTIADDPGSTGMVLVDGAGSAWTNSGLLTVGDLGSATLTVNNAGAVSAQSIMLGAQLGSSGSMSIADTGSTAESTTAVHVGSAGAGTIAVVNGGQLTVGTGYTQAATGTLEVTLGVDSVPAVVVTNTAQLGGTLTVTLSDGFAPAAGTTFEILTANVVSGKFVAMSVPDGAELTIEAARVLIEVVQGSCIGDLDGTGEVGFADLLTLLSTWGPCPGCPADFDDSGVVGFNDLLTILSAWGPCP